jgi:hypothetical protein
MNIKMKNSISVNKIKSLLSRLFIFPIKPLYHFSLMAKRNRKKNAKAIIIYAFSLSAASDASASAPITMKINLINGYLAKLRIIMTDTINANETKYNPFKDNNDDIRMRKSGMTHINIIINIISMVENK